MTITPTNTTWLKEYEGRAGTLHLHEITFKDAAKSKVGHYSSLYKEQTKFVVGEPIDVTTEERTEGKETTLVIKPVYKKNLSDFNKRNAVEKARYSGMAMSYAKDLAVSGIIELKDISKYATLMFNHMVALDDTHHNA